jgi:hypothetical protein
MVALMILWEIHGRADPVITRVTERLAHAYNDGKAYFGDRRQ